MANLADNVLALNVKLDAVLAAVQAIPATGTSTDLTPVLDAVADVKTLLVPTPVSAT